MIKIVYKINNMPHGLLYSIRFLYSFLLLIQYYLMEDKNVKDYVILGID